MDDPALLRETKAAMAETGVGVLDIEFVKITPEIDIAALEPFVAAGAELGARYVITAPYDPDLARLADRLGAMSDLCGRYGLRAVLEFFPWTEVPTSGRPWRRGRRGPGRTAASWWTRCISPARPAPLEQFQGVPASRFPFVHVCDAPAGTSWTRSSCSMPGASSGFRPARAGSTSKPSLRTCRRIFRWRWKCR